LFVSLFFSDSLFPEHQDAALETGGGRLPVGVGADGEMDTVRGPGATTERRALLGDVHSGYRFGCAALDADHTGKATSITTSRSGREQEEVVFGRQGDAPHTPAVTPLEEPFKAATPIQ